MNIKESIIKGYKNGYSENYMLNTQGGDFQSEIAEYLITVNIAQELLKWRNKLSQNYLYAIRLEYSSSDFKKNIFPAIKFKETDSIFDSEILSRQRHSPARNENGRIDIAILKDPVQEMARNPRSVAGIEVKGINPDLNKVEHDIIRLIDFIQTEDHIADNSLDGCWMVYGKRIDRPSKHFSERDLEPRLLALKSEVEGRIGNIPRINEVSPTVELFKISSTTAEEFTSSGIDPSDPLEYREVVEATGAIYGVLVHVENKK